jgi:hypothetical protein
MERRGRELVYSAGGRSVAFPWDTFASEGIFGHYAGLLGDKWSVIAAYNDSRLVFFLAGFQGKGGKPVWKAMAWSSGRTHLLGQPSPQWVELTAMGDTVFVFSGDMYGMQVEAFDLATGACRFRFDTDYWLHTSERGG